MGDGTDRIAEEDPRAAQRPGATADDFAREGKREVTMAEEKQEIEPSHRAVEPSQGGQTGSGDSPRHHQEKVGIVKSAKMQKTIVVEVYRRVQHPVYKRIVTKRSKFMVHDEHK